MPYATAGCCVVLFYLLVSHINYLFIGLGRFAGYISPVIIALIIAYILDPLADWIEHRVFINYGNRPNMRRLMAVWITIVCVLVLITIFMVSLVPQIVKSLKTFFSNFDAYAASLQNVLNRVSLDLEQNSLDISSITQILDNAIEKTADYIQANLGRIVNGSINAGRAVVNIGISFILAIYILCDKMRLQQAWKRLLRALLPERTCSTVSFFWNKCNKILIKYIAGNLLDGLIVGVANFIFMALTGMDFALLISMIVGITNLAPTFGPLVGAIVGALFLVFVNPWYAFLFLVFTIILQTLDGYIIKPRLFGNTLGVSSLWILISIIVLGRMFGIVGILLAIPFAAISDFLYKEVLLYKLELRREEKRAALAEAEAKRAADYAAMKAAKEAIEAVVKKDSLAGGTAEEREKLASVPEMRSGDK